MNRCTALSFIILILIIACKMSANAQLFNPSDPKATNETKQLFYSMQRLKGAGTIFGHHDDTAYGVGWCFVKDQSDVKSVTGVYPALYGWDLAKIEHDSVRDINGIPFKYQRQLVREAYQRGGINTFCWHMDNPANGKTAWDTTMRTVATILPGGQYHETYKQWLDKAATYMADLKGHDGEQIPILFRPFHELTGNWFWWCANTCTPEEFKQLWRFTIDYLRQTKKLHNLLIVFSEADFNSEEEFMQRYPGNNYVDFIGFDNYCYKNIDDYKYNLDLRLGIVNDIAKRNNKLSCLPETGYEQIPQSNWWTTVLLPILAKYQPSYAMVWRNGRPDHYYAPYPGQISEADFKVFFASPQVIFENRIAPLGVYGKYVLKKYDYLKLSFRTIERNLLRC